MKIEEDSVCKMDELKDFLMKRSRVLFELHVFEGEQEKGSSSGSPKDKLSCMHLRWNYENFNGVIAHIKDSVQQLYFPYCEDTEEILILHDTFVIVNDDDVQCLVQDMTYPHNILPVECRCTKQDDSDRYARYNFISSIRITTSTCHQVALLCRERRWKKARVTSSWNL
jgi:hypothetical protein